MSTEANKALVRRYLDEVWNKANHTIIDEVIAPDFVQHAAGVPPGRTGVKGFFSMIGSAFSDVNFEVEDLMAEDDKVIWRWSLHATHTGVFRGIPPAGKQVTITGMNIARITDGTISENWGEQDNLSLLQQLGAIPAPG